MQSSPYRQPRPHILDTTIYSINRVPEPQLKNGPSSKRPRLRNENIDDKATISSVKRSQSDNDDSNWDFKDRGLDAFSRT